MIAAGGVLNAESCSRFALQFREIATIVGGGSASFSGDGGPATSAGVCAVGVAVDAWDQSASQRSLQAGRARLLSVGQLRGRYPAGFQSCGPRMAFPWL